ncbi:MAG: isoprenylcysteine carboxylmethyltransferase family protein [Bacteroidales bacterium]|nr:isoprenylcysteine carboxylmethyltransferase family protein [Bacteroidales bacterium]
MRSQTEQRDKRQKTDAENVDKVYMERFIIFAALSIPVIIISWRTLFNLRSHGFYRFLSWECILWLFASNYKYWFVDPFSVRQIFSWLFLIVSAYVVIAGVLQLKKRGRSGRDSRQKTLYRFEETSLLVDTGIFKYIRHPLYSSLLFLTWGILLKNITLQLLIISTFSTVFLIITAIIDEKECIDYFGDAYRLYMKRTRMFVPFLL